MPELPELTSHTGYWLRQVSNHVSHAFARKVASKGVTVAEWVLMRIIYSAQPAAPSQLADQMGMTRGAITKLANRLISKSLIVRVANSSDGRAQTLHLTARGEKLLPELAALADQNEAESFRHMTSKDRTTLMRILRETVAKLGINATPIE
jgi:DNA-binding MarR family transcriptional regulator